MPQDKPARFIIDHELAEALAKRDKARNARAHDTAAAKAQIAARCQSNPSFERHARKCAICNHPDCDFIESDFVNWRSENTIVLNYQLPSRSSVYRHAAAAGLLERRRANLRGVCERIIEHVDQAPPSGMAVLRALRIYSQITEDGHWVEPPKHSLVTHVHVTEHTTTVGAGLSRLQNGSSCHSEPSAPPLAPTFPCHPEPVRASRGRCEGSAVHDELQNGSAPSASRSVPDLDDLPPCPEGRRDPGEPVAPDLDYVPHWARGLYPDNHKIPASAQTPCPIGSNPHCDNNLEASPAREILIGTQNASRENASRGKRGG